MATHSSILAWKIPWTEEPGGLSPWGRKESDTTEHTWGCSVSAEKLGQKEMLQVGGRCCTKTSAPSASWLPWVMPG